MPDRKFEDRIKEHAGEIFGQGVELPAGHRARFEQRLKDINAQGVGEAATQTENEIVNQSIISISLRRLLTVSIAAAAVILGFIFLRPSLTSEQQNPELAEVRNYYNMQLEEQVDATIQLIQHVDEAHRTEFLVNVEQIENDPIPDVQITDDEYIVLIASIYTNKIESLQNIQNLLKEII